MMMNGDDSEKRLIVELRKSSKIAFTILYHRWAGKLFAYVLSYVKSKEITKDIVQETFVRLWQKREALRPVDTLGAYLFTISYHLILAEFKHSLANYSINQDVELSLKIPASDGYEANASLDFDDIIKQLERSKKKLSARQFQIFELKYLHGYSTTQIANLFGLADQTVNNELSIARSTLKKQLKR